MRCVPQLWLMILSAGYGIASPLARQAATIVIEAEDGQLSGTQISTNGSGFSGSGFVDGFDSGGSVAFTVNVSEAGSYYTTLTYIAPQGVNEADVTISKDGTLRRTVGARLRPASDFTSQNIGAIPLTVGDNLITIKSDTAGFGLDVISIVYGGTGGDM